MNKKLVVTLGAVLGLGLVAGCGSSDSPGSAASSQSPSSTGGQTTAPRELTPVDADQWFADLAAANAQTTTVHVAVDETVVTDGGPETTLMAVDVDATSARYAVDMEVMGAPAEIVVADGTAYVVVGNREPQALSRTALGLTDVALDPATALESEREAVVAVERVGSESEKVGDVEAHHYVVTYDVARLNELLGADPAGGTVQGDTVTADVWLDAEGRPVRYTATRATEVAGQTSTVTTDAVYSDYGKAVTIEVPQ